MLTFANDALPIVESIAKLFRSKQPRIGVLILQEQEKEVYSRAEEFIDDCFNQVDLHCILYIVLLIKFVSYNYQHNEQLKFKNNDK